MAGLDDLLSIVRRKNLVCHIGYNFRFHPALIRMKELIDANAVYRAGDDAAVSKAEEIVKRHMSAHPDLMAVAPAERAAAHAK